MEHPFLSRRREAERATQALALLKDLRTISWGMTEAVHAKLRARRDSEIPDDALREAVLRHSDRLGLLLEDVDKVADTGLHKAHGEAWAQLVLEGKVLPQSALEAAENAVRACDAVLEEVKPTEADDGSSSYSDYTDSHTVSSEEGEEDDEDEDD